MTSPPVDAFAWLVTAPLLLGAYLLGAIPFGLLLVRRFAHQDVRQSGSGNIGATNVARVAGKTLGAATLALDALKGSAPVLLARWADLPEPVCAMAGAAAFLGHCFPVYLRFKGGKGIATGFGVVLAFQPAVAGVALTVYALTYLVTRISSISSLASVTSVAAMGIWVGIHPVTLALLGAMLVVIILKHIPNLRRLFKGQELKV